MNLPLIVFLIGFVLMFITRMPLAFGMMATSIAYLAVAHLDIGLMAEKVLTNLFSTFTSVIFKTH